MTQSPVLLIGGYGITGKAVARLLRNRHPKLALTIAGRSLEDASLFAEEIGAEAKAVDLLDANFGFHEVEASLVLVLAKDAGLNGLTWAKRKSVPYIGLSSAAFEHGIDVTHALVHPQTSPVVIAGHWFAGAAMLAAIDLARGFDEIDSIVAGITIDREGEGGGPASIADFERISRSTTATLARVNGAYKWESEEERSNTYHNVNGEIVTGTGAVSLDVASIAASTGALNVRVLETWGVSKHYIETGIPADEVAIEVVGKINDARVMMRRTLELSRDHHSLTAVTLVLLIERILGLDGSPAAPAGFYTPELMLDPASYIRQLEDAGVKVRTQQI